MNLIQRRWYPLL